MRATLEARPAPQIVGLRQPVLSDEAELASLMLDSYMGTVDYEGESLTEAIEEVRSTLSGSKGPFLWSASRVIEKEGVLASACLVIRWEDQPLVAFSMTRAAFKQRGLARASLEASMSSLCQQGEATVALFVTVANSAAVHLYESLGFAPSAA
jgi:RimJ/RimL family protein N-acetyltransferase